MGKRITLGRRRGRGRNSRKKRGGGPRERAKTILTTIMNCVLMGIFGYALYTGPGEAFAREMQQGYEMWQAGTCGGLGNRLFGLVGAGNRFCTFMNRANGNILGLLLGDALAHENIERDIIRLVGVWTATAAYIRLRNRVADMIVNTVMPEDRPALEAQLRQDIASGRRLQAPESQTRSNGGVELIADEQLPSALRGEIEQMRNQQQQMMDSIREMSARMAEAILATRESRGDNIQEIIDLGEEFDIPTEGRAIDVDDIDNSQDTFSVTSSISSLGSPSPFGSPPPRPRREEREDDLGLLRGTLGMVPRSLKVPGEQTKKVGGRRRRKKNRSRSKTRSKSRKRNRK